MSGGERIVAFFQRLGVPNADSLNPEDLDWMLESGNKDGTHSIQYNGCRYKGQEFPVLKISAKIRVKAGNPVLNQSGIRVKEWDSLMIFAKKILI